jgi:hypothetical protein
MKTILVQLERNETSWLEQSASKAIYTKGLVTRYQEESAGRVRRSKAEIDGETTAGDSPTTLTLVV